MTPSASLTFKARPYDPALRGTPLRVAVLESSLRPRGSFPRARLQTRGATPPRELKRSRNLFPTVAAGALVVVIARRAAILKVTVVLTACPSESVTLTGRENDPAEVGAPEMMPWAVIEGEPCGCRSAPAERSDAAARGDRRPERDPHLPGGQVCRSDCERRGDCERVVVRRDTLVVANPHREGESADGGRRTRQPAGVTVERKPRWKRPRWRRTTRATLRR